ncbi:MAG: hypothetical protein ACOCVZ_01780 [Gemmatimonadota bacterium]
MTPTPAPQTVPKRPTLRQRRARDRRVLATGLAVSLAIHLVAVGVVGGWLEPQPRPATAPVGPALVQPPPGMRLVEVRPLPDDALTEPERPGEDERPPATAPPMVASARTDSVPAAADSMPADALTAADRLAPRVVDPRLWRPMVLIPREPTFEDVQARIAEAVELLSDSALADAEAAVRARDWTVEDAKGGKWGISPGKLHLGSLTLPLPIWFPEDPEARAEQELWYELDRQLERSMILESFEDRVRAIRERRERERAEAKGASNGG